MIKKQKKKPRKGLSGRVETIRQNDTRDPHPEEHAAHFFSTFKEGLLLPKIDLSTQEGAEDALKVLERQSELLDQRSKAIRALRKLAEDGH